MVFDDVVGIVEIINCNSVKVQVCRTACWNGCETSDVVGKTQLHMMKFNCSFSLWLKFAKLLIARLRLQKSF